MGRGCRPPRKRDLPEVHSLHLKCPLGRPERPLQLAWKAPRQRPSHNSSSPGFSQTLRREKKLSLKGPRARIEGPSPLRLPSFLRARGSFKKNIIRIHRVEVHSQPRPSVCQEDTSSGHRAGFNEEFPRKVNIRGFLWWRKEAFAGSFLAQGTLDLQRFIW